MVDNTCLHLLWIQVWGCGPNGTCLARSGCRMRLWLEWSKQLIPGVLYNLGLEGSESKGTLGWWGGWIWRLFGRCGHARDGLQHQVGLVLQHSLVADNWCMASKKILGCIKYITCSMHAYTAWLQVFLLTHHSAAFVAQWLEVMGIMSVLTLKLGTVYQNIFPISTLLVVGTMRFRFWGTLLAVSAPISTCSVWCPSKIPWRATQIACSLPCLLQLQVSTRVVCGLR